MKEADVDCRDQAPRRAHGRRSLAMPLRRGDGGNGAGGANAADGRKPAAYHAALAAVVECGRKRRAISCPGLGRQI
jgi:hypothetical protein